jgi:hypothetical protein
MPRTEILSNFHIQATKSQETDIVRGEDGEETLEMVDVWTITLTDRQTPHRILISFRKDARDELVRQLTGGVVLAGGELPKL